MTWVPAVASEVLPGTPIAGTVEQIDAIGAFLQDASLDAWSYQLGAQQAQRDLGSMIGAAIVRIDSKLGDLLVPGAAKLMDSSTSAKQAVDGYAAEVDRIHNDAIGLRNSVEDSLASIRSQADTIAMIGARINVNVSYEWNVGAPGHMPEPRLMAGAEDLSEGERIAAARNLRMMYEDQWLHAAASWHAGIEDVSTAKTKWVTLIEERKQAEQHLVSMLKETVLGQLIALGTGGEASLKRTIAVAISGELWGVRDAPRPLSTEHPLLEQLIGRRDGSDVWDNPGDPVAIAENWASLQPYEQQALIAAVPSVIGNLPGLPYWVRDQANRNQVEFYRQHPQLLTAEQLTLMAELQQILSREEGQAVPDPPIQLVALDLCGPTPKVAVGYGDLDSATHTTWAVPGMSSDAVDGLAGMDESSRNLYKAQDQLPDFSGKNAVVAWLGYDTPEVPPGDWGVVGSEYAMVGAPRFAAELDGQYVARSTGEYGVPVTNVLAHSYGTTMVTIALTLTVHPVDSLVMLGSAGLDTEAVKTLDALNVKEVSPGQRAIYTTHASGDHIAPAGAGLAGRGQPNPDATALRDLQNYSPVYGGALSFSSDGNPAQGLLATNGHSMIGEGDEAGWQGTSASEGHGYMDPRTQSLSTIAKITSELVDEGLAGSFVITEAQHVELIADFHMGSAVPVRVKGEE